MSGISCVVFSTLSESSDPLACLGPGQVSAAHVLLPLRHLPVQQRSREAIEEHLQTHLLRLVPAPRWKQELPEFPLHPQPGHGTFRRGLVKIQPGSAVTGSGGFLAGAPACLPHTCVTAVDGRVPAHLLAVHGRGRLHGALSPPECCWGRALLSVSRQVGSKIKMFVGDSWRRPDCPLVAQSGMK